MTPNGSRSSVPHQGAGILAVLGFGWLFVACSVAYLTVATPLLSRVVLAAAESARLPMAPLIAIACLATLPVAWGVAGASRIATAARIARLPAPTTALRRVAGRLEPPAIILGGVRVSAWRAVPEVLVTLQGVVVVREITQDRYRLADGHWEAAAEFGWTPCESPFEAAIRDADGIRHLIAASELDFVVRVHTIVVTDAYVDRVSGCGLVHPDMLESYLVALPPQRTLTESRVGAIARLLARTADLNAATR